MNIRTETNGDWTAVFNLHYRAFGNREDVYEVTEGTLGTVRGELKYPGSFFA